MSERLIDFITILALETSCEASARIMQTINIEISGDTLIHMLLKNDILMGCLLLMKIPILLFWKDGMDLP